MNRVKLVKQHSGKDCVFCCVCMHIGITYEEGERKLGSAFMSLLHSEGCTQSMEHVILKEMGFDKDKDYKVFVHSPHWSSVAFTRNILWGRPALVTVRSKNNEDGKHMIYWTGEYVMDPSTKKIYDSWDEVEVLEMVVFLHSR